MIITDASCRSCLRLNSWCWCHSWLMPAADGWLIAEGLATGLAASWEGQLRLTNDSLSRLFLLPQWCLLFRWYWYWAFRHCHWYVYIFWYMSWYFAIAIIYFRHIIDIADGHMILPLIRHNIIVATQPLAVNFFFRRAIFHRYTLRHSFLHFHWWVAIDIDYYWLAITDCIGHYCFRYFRFGHWLI